MIIGTAVAFNAVDLPSKKNSPKELGEFAKQIKDHFDLGNVRFEHECPDGEDFETLREKIKDECKALPFNTKVLGNSMFRIVIVKRC